MYDYNEPLSVVSRTTLNERQVQLCRVYVARIIGGGGGTTYKTVKFSLQILAVFLIRVASLLSMATVGGGGDSTLEFFPPLKQNIKLH